MRNRIDANSTKSHMDMIQTRQGHAEQETFGKFGWIVDTMIREMLVAQDQHYRFNCLERSRVDLFLKVLCVLKLRKVKRGVQEEHGQCLFANLTARVKKPQSTFILSMACFG